MSQQQHQALNPTNPKIAYFYYCVAIEFPQMELYSASSYRNEEKAQQTKGKPRGEKKARRIFRLGVLHRILQFMASIEQHKLKYYDILNRIN